ncbi:MAG: glycine cleavage system protein GcvH [Pseudomonadota bacterium]|nr:glycine cleavage system protein GcvH [Pseudomonadota bacterium]
MNETRYTDDHEWARLDGDLVVVGITDYAQEQLGDIVFVELPEIGGGVSQGEEAAVIESVKAAGDVKSPVTGSIAAINEVLIDAPETVNQDPTGEGWFYKVQPSDIAELDDLLDESAYNRLISGLA